MLVSYTIAAPIWKTTYRVVLDSTGKPFFRGGPLSITWSDEDWNKVSLSLVSLAGVVYPADSEAVPIDTGRLFPDRAI